VMTRHARAVEEDRDEEAALHLAPAEDDDVPEAAHSGGAPRAPRAEHTTDVDQPRHAPAADDDGAQLRPRGGKQRLDCRERRTLPCIHGLIYGSQTNGCIFGAGIASGVCQRSSPADAYVQMLSRRSCSFVV